MIHCPDSTALRAHLDHPQAGIEAHLDTCSACSGLLRSVASDAGFVKQALALLDADIQAEPADAEQALRALPPPEMPVSPTTPTSRRSQGGANPRTRLLYAAAAVFALLLALTPSGQSAVAEVLDAFRGEKLQVVTVDPDAFAASLSPESEAALAALGDVDLSGLREPVPVANLAEAETLAGIAAPRLDSNPDRVVALEPGSVRLVLTARGGNDVPDELDGAVLHVDVPGAIGAFYGSSGGEPEFAVGRSGLLVATAEGASLEAIRSFLLSREELPEDLRAQLEAIEDWRSTIPVPIPVDGPGWEETEVAGRPAIAFGDDTGLGALVVRQDPGGVTVIAGRIGLSEALQIAARA